MTTQPDRPKRRSTSLGFVEQPDDDTLRLKTFWSPLPAWAYPTFIGIIIGVIAVGIASATGSAGDDMLTVASFGFIGGYFAGAFIWAAIGAIGGDVLRVTFDMREDVAHVHQSLFWIWKRDWQFELDEIERLHTWEERGRLFLRLNVNHFVVLTLEGSEPLRLGKYPTEMEMMAVAQPIAAFLGIPIRRNQRPGADE